MLNKITIINRHHKGPKGQYIGRGSPLGNTYPITAQLPRREAIAKYKLWLKAEMATNNLDVMNEIIRLWQLAQHQPIALECYCSPLPCHGEVIRDVLIALDK